MSKKFREYKGLDLTKVAEETLAFWEAEHIFEKSISTRDEKKSYVFYEGPPSANGLPNDLPKRQSSPIVPSRSAC